MKKLLSLLTAILFAGSMMAAVDYTLVYTLDGTQKGGTNGYATESKITQDGLEWGILGNTQENPWRIGGNGTDLERTVSAKAAFADNVAKIEIEHDTATATVNSITIEVAEDAQFENVISSFTPEFEEKATMTVLRPNGTDWSGCFYRITYNVSTSGSKNQFVALVSIKFYKAPDVYTVSGETLALFYHPWRAYHDYGYTDMTKQSDGTYKWDREEVKLPKGDVEFKVCINQSFKVCWPAGDPYKLAIPENGEYTVTIIFDPATETIVATADKTGPATFHDPMYLYGSWDNWNAAKLCIIDEDNAKTLVTVSLTAGDYQFKFKNQDNVWFGNKEEFSRDNASHRGVKSVAGTDNNMILHADKDGDYIFTWVFDAEEVIINFPGKVPSRKIAPLAGVFTINAEGDKVNFARGNLQYNIGEDAWYCAEKQYQVLGDANLRLGDETYKGSVDLFSWSCESSNFGLLPSGKDADFTGDFIDWGTLFSTNEEWRTFTKAELTYLLGRKDANNNKLWTTIGVGPDSIFCLALFPDEWTAPQGITINYGIYDFDKQWAALEANCFTLEQWAQMEEAGAVVLPAGGARAGAWNNHITDGVKEEPTMVNPLTGSYCWISGENWTGYYWLSDLAEGDAKLRPNYFIFGDWAWGEIPRGPRERRRGHNIRLITPAAPPATFFITGNDALVGAKAWNPEAVKVTEDSYTFTNLPAGDYKLKVTLNGTWDDGQVKGFGDLTEKAEGLRRDKDGNICFSLAEPSNVTVTYTGSAFKVEGNFHLDYTKVYVVLNNIDWAEVWAFVWETDLDPFKAWPGEILKELTNPAPARARLAQQEGKKVYSYEFPNFYDNIIFSNNAGKQTVDLKWSEEYPYFWIGKEIGEGKYDGEWTANADDPTDIDNTASEIKAMKILKDGQIFILKNGNLYNLTGQEMR